MYGIYILMELDNGESWWIINENRWGFDVVVNQQILGSLMLETQNLDDPATKQASEENSFL